MASAVRCASDRSACRIGCRGKSGGATRDGAAYIRFETGIHGIEQLSAGNHHHVEALARRQEITSPENLSYQSFSAVSPHSVAKLSRGDNSQAPSASIVGSDEHRHIPPLGTKREVKDTLELFVTPDAASLRKAFGLRWHSRGSTLRANGYEEETVRRLRPFALRRLSTWRPFFVAIRTRNPCVRFRRRRFGWNVTLIVGSPATEERWRRNLNSNQTVETLSIRAAMLSPVETVCYSRFPCAGNRRVTPRSFPQLWKKMWKSKGFQTAQRDGWRSEAAFAGAKGKKGRIYKAWPAGRVGSARVDRARLEAKPLHIAPFHSQQAFR